MEEEQTDVSDNTLSPHSNGNKAKYQFLQEYEPPSHYARISPGHHDFYHDRHTNHRFSHFIKELVDQSLALYFSCQVVF